MSRPRRGCRSRAADRLAAELRRWSRSLAELANVELATASRVDRDRVCHLIENIEFEEADESPV
jgi:hypothetical protein